ncbi:hypothetical protein KFL_001940130 [Klebsormidium nitens]|uniref:Uncharacterized protein n=1 Tax=Klebsormidium nitens TaxID=105231 RepID=A0A1Y1I753_KLENI|nr:hypothetical protein KFL_001940130 [Klebsormidium nitens]|eukprot:GAQ84556.1 hypothetical protein KFL_001940130 [Klebsormidium nitens]
MEETTPMSRSAGVRRGPDGRPARVESESQSWADIEASEPDTWQISSGGVGRESGGQRVRQGRNPSDHGRSVRAAPVKSLQELRGALVAETEALQTGRAQDGPSVQNLDSSLLVLSGELDSLVSFGDVRAYLGPEAGQCSIRRNGQEFSLQFSTPESARRCLDSIAAEDPARLSRPGASIVGKPLIKGARQRRVFVHMRSGTVASELPTPFSLQHSVPVKVGSREADTKSIPKTSLEKNKPAPILEKGLLGPAPIDTKPSAPSKQQMHAEPHVEPSLETLPSDPFSQETLSQARVGGTRTESSKVESIGGIATDRQGGGQGDELHELLVQETLRLLSEKARLQKEAQEKGRMVDRLERHVELLQRELDAMHSRLLMSESVVPVVADCPETADAPSMSAKSKSSEEASKKRKKSGPATSPSGPIPTLETVTTIDPTGWGVNKLTEVEQMDVGPTSWGSESASPATPLDWNDGITSKAGGFHISPSEESGPSGRSSRNRHRRGEKQLWGVAKGRGQGSKRVEAPPQERGWEEGASGSSEATDPRLSHSSSVKGFGEENMTTFQKGGLIKPPKRGPPQAGLQWDVRSSTSSVGDGGLSTPPLQDGEWEWPTTPGKQASPGPGRRVSPRTIVPGKGARLDSNRGREAPEPGTGLLPVPTGWGENSVAVDEVTRHFEAGENAGVGGKSPKDGRRGRETGGRARKKAAGQQREGDYAGAPREREAPDGKWPRGLVT